MYHWYEGVLITREAVHMQGKGVYEKYLYVLLNIALNLQLQKNIYIYLLKSCV